MASSRKQRHTHRLSRFVGSVPVISQILFWYYCYVRTSRQPPQLFNYVGSPEFADIGKSHFANIVRLGGVTPNDRVLDVGCGIGRVATHFVEFLDVTGRYEGFDVVKKGPQWCNHKIAGRYANFSFQHVDVYNRHYNKRGRIAATQFVFPYDDSSFDFVFATSVFTHMLPDSVAQYLREVCRVLRPGGRCFISYFLLNDAAKQHMSRSRFDFRCVDERYGVMSEDDPEAAIAYEETFLETLYRECGMTAVLPIHYGNWSGRTGDVVGQDIIVARKGAANTR